MAQKKKVRKNVKKATRRVRKSPAKKTAVRILKSNKKQVNWILVLVLSIFLGMLGVDRFIMGKVGTGILKLLITVLTLFVFGGWIWWIIDIVLIALRYDFEGIQWVD